MIVCDRCKNLGKTAEPVTVTMWAGDPRPAGTRSGQQTFSRRTVFCRGNLGKPECRIDLCTDCQEELAARLSAETTNFLNNGVT